MISARTIRSTSRVPHDVMDEGECETQSLSCHVSVCSLRILLCAAIRICPQVFKFKRLFELRDKSILTTFHASGARLIDPSELVLAKLNHGAARSRATCRSS